MLQFIDPFFDAYDQLKYAKEFLNTEVSVAATQHKKQLIDLCRTIINEVEGRKNIHNENELP